MRDELDRYYTPPALAESCVGALWDELHPGSVSEVLEPSIGAGAFANAVDWRLPELGQVIGVDLDGAAPASRDYLTVRGSFLDYDWARMSCDVSGLAPEYLHPRPHLVIGNPPYRDAEQHVAKALDVSARHVAFLLRASFLGSSRRAGNLWQHSPLRKVWFVSPRPSFTGNGKTDGAEYAFFWWDKRHSGAATIDWIRGWR